MLVLEAVEEASRDAEAAGSAVELVRRGASLPGARQQTRRSIHHYQLLARPTDAMEDMLVVEAAGAACTTGT